MTNAAQIGQLMQWLSPAYPVGSFAYSHGLERAVHDGWVRDGVSLQPWLEDILTDGAGFSDAYLLFSAANAPDAQNLRDIDTLAQSLSPSKERLAETRDQGRAFSLMTQTLESIAPPVSDAPFSRYRPQSYPVALGAAVRAYNLPAHLAACLYLQNFASNLIGAAQRLNLLGQSQGQRILSQLIPLCQNAATAAKETDPGDLSNQTYLSDITAMRHETQSTRIFRT
jgi:urease accessory protein